MGSGVPGKSDYWAQAWHGLGAEQEPSTETSQGFKMENLDLSAAETARSPANGEAGRRQPPGGPAGDCFAGSGWPPSTRGRRPGYAGCAHARSEHVGRPARGNRWWRLPGWGNRKRTSAWGEPFPRRKWASKTPDESRRPPCLVRARKRLLVARFAPSLGHAVGLSNFVRNFLDALRVVAYKPGAYRPMLPVFATTPSRSGRASRWRVAGGWRVRGWGP
jgi:hypothetical protein